MDQFLVPRIIRRRWPAAADHREIHHGVRDSCLAQEAGGLSGHGRLADSDRPGYQEDRNDGHVSLRQRRRVRAELLPRMRRERLSTCACASWRTPTSQSPRIAVRLRRGLASMRVGQSQRRVRRAGLPLFALGRRCRRLAGQPRQSRVAANWPAPRFPSPWTEQRFLYMRLRCVELRQARRQTAGTSHRPLDARRRTFGRLPGRRLRFAPDVCSLPLPRAVVRIGKASWNRRGGSRLAEPRRPRRFRAVPRPALPHLTRVSWSPGCPCAI